MPSAKALTLVTTLTSLLGPLPVIAQVPTGSTALQRDAPPPATKLEAFKPAAGTIVVLGYKGLGSLPGISIDAREMRGVISIHPIGKVDILRFFISRIDIQMGA